MPRRRNPDRPSRAKQPVDLAPVFVRRPDLCRLTGLTEGYLRQQEARGTAPQPVRIEGSRVVLYELEPWLTWLRRHAASPAA